MIEVGRVLVAMADKPDCAIGHVVNLQSFADPNLAAVLIKKYLRDLPEPIFPESLYPAIRRCPMPSDDPGDVAAVTYVRESLLPLLPHCAYVLLSHVLREGPRALPSASV
jgi:Rho GTPase-activating protein 1